MAQTPYQPIASQKEMARFALSPNSNKVSDNIADRMIFLELDGCIVWNAHKYSNRLEALGYLCDCVSRRVQR